MGVSKGYLFNVLSGLIGRMFSDCRLAIRAFNRNWAAGTCPSEDDSKERLSCEEVVAVFLDSSEHASGFEVPTVPEAHATAPPVALALTVTLCPSLVARASRCRR